MRPPEEDDVRRAGRELDLTKDCNEILASLDWGQGMASPALFRHDALDAMGLCHGDDFLLLSDDKGKGGLDELLRSRYEVELTAVLGAGSSDHEELIFLSRTLRLVVDGDDWYLQLERDDKHARLLIEEFSLELGNAASSPAVKKKAERQQVTC